MSPFIVREIVGGVLIPLAQLAPRLPLSGASFIAFKEVRFNAGCILGVPVPEFERLSRDLLGGFIISKQDFHKVLTSEVQMIDGVIEFLGSNSVVLLRIECIDASQWELTTELPEIEAQLERSGFKR